MYLQGAEIELPPFTTLGEDNFSSAPCTEFKVGGYLFPSVAISSFLILD